MELQCRRCGARAEGLDAAPLPGPAGAAVLGGTCRTCWTAWLARQVVLLNEDRLSPADPAHYARLLREMLLFLKLDATP
jgi:Fe-S cluster biosynthesis and repair protein YggX